jgi:hypothetical protein
MALFTVANVPKPIKTALACKIDGDISPVGGTIQLATNNTIVVISVTQKAPLLTFPYISLTDILNFN